jgi:hypothetical protein
LAKVVFCPFDGRGKSQGKKDAGSEHSKLRSPGERTIAQLKRGSPLTAATAGQAVSPQSLV